MHTKTVGRLAGIAALAAAFVAVNSNAPFAVTAAEATEVNVPFDAAADRSHEDAQAHFDRFFAFAVSPSAARATPQVQIELGTELVWVAPVAQTADGFSGVILTDGALESGDTVAFTRNDVRDWTFVGRSGKIYGSFQTRARLPHLSRQKAAPIRAVLASSVVPVDW